jgi:heat shock protein 4
MLYSHITDEEREKVRSLTDSTSAWLYDLLDKQGALAPNKDLC